MYRQKMRLKWQRLYQHASKLIGPITLTAKPMGEHLERHRWNSLYLIAALTMIFMALAVAAQPLYLRKVMNISPESAGTVNANVQVITELLALLAVGWLGFLSDRFGRVPLVVAGFMIGACGGFLAPVSFALGTFLGIGGVVLYYFSRLIMVFGTSAVWPQLTTLAGDFTVYRSRAHYLANANFMMAFGSTIAFTVLMQIPRFSGILPVMLLNALLGLLGALLAHRLLIDIAPKRCSDSIPWQRVRDVIIQEPKLRIAFAVSLFSRSDIILIGLFYMLWTIYYAESAGLSQEAAAARAGVLSGYVGILVMVTILVWGQVVQRVGRIKAIIGGLSISGAGFLLMLFVDNPFSPFVYIPMTMISLGQASLILAPDILALDIAPQDMRGSIMGPMNVVSGVGLIIILEIGGLLFDALGPHAPFVFTGIGNFIVLLYIINVYRYLPKFVAEDENTDKIIDSSNQGKF